MCLYGCKQRCNRHATLPASMHPACGRSLVKHFRLVEQVGVQVALRDTWRGP